jgi:glycosyltransferase involved in cell wall biosynthesis
MKELIRPYYLRWLYFRLFPRAQPQHWKDCWRFPSFALDRLPRDVKQPNARDFLILPMTDWHARMQRPQQLARALADRGHRCFYLNPNLGREFPAPPYGRPRARLSALETGVWELHAGLPREPVFHHRLLRPAEDETLAQCFSTLARAFSMRRPIVLAGFPVWMDVAVTIRDCLGAPLVYDCHDLLGGFAGIAPEIVAREAALFDAADLVLFSARSLMDSKLVEFPALRAKSLLMRNGVDASLFRPAAGPRAGGPERVIGYAGSLDAWFDIEAVRRAALAWPDWEFRLYGRIEDKRILGLQALSNVRFQGEIPYQALPAALAACDAALIPFLRNPLTMATNPIKLYEYFACGLPVVSAPLPEVEQFADLVYLADSPEKFAEAVGRAAREQDPDRRQRRLTIAAEESWQARADQLLAAVP